MDGKRVAILSLIVTWKSSSPLGASNWRSLPEGRKTAARIYGLVTAAVIAAGRNYEAGAST